MNQKYIAVIASIIIVSAAVAIVVVMNDKGSSKSNDEVVAGMVMSLGGETFGFGDMGTYYLHGANVYHENLVCVDKEGKYTGLLAESWSTNTNASTWTFVLRDDVKWHDGEKFTAEDVIFTIRYTLDKKPWGLNDAAFLNDLKSPTSFYKGTNGDGKETITIEMNGPYSNLLLNMRAGLSILPEHIYKNVADPMKYGNPNGELNATIGTGPFIVKNLDTTTRTMTLERNDEYYLGDVHAKKFTIRYYSDANVMSMALKNKDIDICLAWGSGITAAAAESLKNSDVVLKEENSAGISGIAFNCKKAPFDNKDVRLALSYAVNYQKFVELIGGGHGAVPGKSTIPSSMLYYKDNGLLSYNPTIAKAKLNALGYVDTDSDGWLNVPGGGDNWRPTLAFNALSANKAQIIKEGFNAVGVDLQLESVATAWGAWKRQVDSEGNRKYDMVISGCSHLGTYTYCNYGTTVVSANGGLKDCQVDTAEFNAILNELKAAGTDAEMKVAAENLQDWYAANLPIIPLYEQKIITAYGNNVAGVYLDPQFAHTICHDTLMEVGFK